MSREVTLPASHAAAFNFTDATRNTLLWQRASAGVNWLVVILIMEAFPKVSLLYKCIYSLDHTGTSCCA